MSSQESLGDLSEHGPKVEFIHFLASQFSHATELAAIAAATTAGLGDKKASDAAAVTAMREFLNGLNINGRVVIGEGERDEAPMLFIGETLGSGSGPEVDIAVDPLENTNATAVFGPRAISVLAVSEKGGLLHAPDMYMDKLVVGPKAKGRVGIDAPIVQNLGELAEALDRNVKDLVVVVLDRERNKKLIDNIRQAGARVKLIVDGDLLPGVMACLEGSGIHALMGIGAAPEGVITAAAVKALNGEMQIRFWPTSDEQRARLKSMGANAYQVYTQEELASGKSLIFSATAVTDGDNLKGVRFFGSGVRTNTLVVSSADNFLKIEWKDTVHSFSKSGAEFKL